MLGNILISVKALALEAMVDVGDVGDGRGAVDVVATEAVLNARDVFCGVLSVSFFAQFPSSPFLFPWHSRHSMLTKRP